MISVKTFGNTVLYLEPKVSQKITELHKLFDGNYADGLPFAPHVTIFIGDDEDVMDAKRILSSYFTPISATVTQIHLSEFFPTKNMYIQKLGNN